MIYKKTDKPYSEIFKNPPSEYRGMPFWAWNTKLDCDELRKQIDIFKEMGYGGFYMHVRQGLETDYLGKEFMDAVRACTDKAKQENMYACLYDEDRWPSGCAGGIVTKEHKYRQKHIYMTAEDEADTANSMDELLNESKSLFLAAFDIELDEHGYMLSYKKIGRDEEGRNKRYFFMGVRKGGEPRFNYQTYSDNLNKETVDKFIDTTYKSFRDNVGDEFGKTIPFIFTDEPQIAWNDIMDSGFTTKKIIKPWTHDFDKTYKEKFGEDIIDSLPEIYFAMKGDGGKRTRYNYYRHISELFSESYMDNIASWCGENGIMFTGHAIGEDAMLEAVMNVCDIMRTYKNMHLPGIDMLCDDRAFITPKQCQSVVHQYGREGMMSEMYGVTNWDFDFRGHKFQGDWQACLGVTHRVPHLAWQTMKGEGKRDYPASISYQSPWYKEYRIIENHFARVATAMTKGVPDVRVAVLHPVETMWMYVCSRSEELDKCLEHDAHFKELTQWLLEGCIDFDYLAESLLEELCTDGAAPMKVGKMTYDAVIVPGCETLRPHTVKLLNEFKKSGGKLIFIGNTPRLSLARENDDAKQLAEGTTVLPHSKYSLINELEDMRQVRIQYENMISTENLMYSMRIDGDDRWMFVSHTRTPQLQLYHIPTEQKLIITVKGCYVPVLYNTMTGDTEPMSYECDGVNTKIRCTVYDFDSLLIKLEHSEGASSLSLPVPAKAKAEIKLDSCCSYTLAEPNVLVLDMPEYSLDGEPFNEAEEILRIDEAVRLRLGLDLRRTKVVQPYYIKNVPEDHRLTLRYTVYSECDVQGVLLAIENGAKVSVRLNGCDVPSDICGSYVDDHIDTIRLPGLITGDNILEISMPFGQRTDLENCFLLGDFGTAYAGRYAYITEKKDKIYYGNAVTQGLAFYGGNIEYNSSFSLPEDGDVEIEVSYYRGAMIRVFVDGEDTGAIAFPPFRVKAENLKAGSHDVKFVLYGNRYNTFSAIHSLLSDKIRVYTGPDYWRSAGEGWAYEYQTRPFGILKTPVVRYTRN